LVNFTAIWNILWPFGIFCGPLVYFVAILVYFSSFGIFYQENLATLLRSGRGEKKESLPSLQIVFFIDVRHQKNGEDEIADNFVTAMVSATVALVASEEGGGGQCL
jgi:hypothetical protein